MKQSNGLKTAEKLFVAQKYDRLISYLLPQLFKYRANSRFYYLLASACFYSGDLAGAESYYKRCSDFPEYKQAAELALAAISYRREEYDKALERWLSITDHDPGNRWANRGLQWLKKYGNTPGKHRESSYIVKLVPKPDVRVKKNIVFPAAMLIAIIFIISSAFYFRDTISEFISDLAQEKVLRPGPSTFDFKEDSLSEEDGQLLVYTENELKRIYNNAEKEFHNYNDNAAQLEVNKILNSNASDELKEQANYLASFFDTPDFTNFTTNYDFDDVNKNPLLHKDCFIKWRGKITNIEITEEKITFDFLVGYDNNKTLLGTVKTYLDFSFIIDETENYEIIAQVDSDINDFQLKVTSIRVVRE